MQHSNNINVTPIIKDLLIDIRSNIISILFLFTVVFIPLSYANTQAHSSENHSNSAPANDNLSGYFSDKRKLIKSGHKLVGQANFSVLFWDIYESKLYTPTGEFKDISPSVLFELTYKRDITKQDLIEKTIEQWEHLEVSKVNYQYYIEPLHNLWPDINEGDSLSISVGVQASHFYHNGIYIGKIEGDRFAALFLNIWLSPKTSQPSLRAQLLGNSFSS